MKCFWIFNHDWSNWSPLLQGYGGYWYQNRKCKKCGRQQIRQVGWAPDTKMV